MVLETSRKLRTAHLLSLATLLIFLSVTSVFAQLIPPPHAPERSAAETDVYLVTFRPDTPASERAAVVQGSGALLRATFTVANAVSVQVPSVAALSALRNDPRVLSVVANRPIT